jgi:hypothetical protein
MHTPAFQCSAAVLSLRLAAFATGGARVAEGQPGHIRTAVQDVAVTGDGMTRAAGQGGSGAITTAPPAAPAAPTFGADVLEITEPVLASFDKALALEEARRQQYVESASSAKSREAYHRCEPPESTSPRGQSLLQRYTEVLDGKEADALLAAAQAFGRRFAGQTGTRYGPDPAGFTPGRRGEGEVRLAGTGRNVFPVHTAADADALRPRRGELIRLPNAEA